MAELKSGIVLNDGEKLVMELEAELWASSANPIAQLWGKIRKFCAALLGNRVEGYLVITDKRVIEVLQAKACWVLNAGKNVKYVLPSSVKEIGYSKEGSICGCFCQTYYLYYESFTQRTNVQLKVSEEAEAQKVVNAFYAAIKAAN